MNILNDIPKFGFLKMHPVALTFATLWWKVFQFEKSRHQKSSALSECMSKAGTGFMVSMTDELRKLQAKGYGENLVPKYDHFEVNSGAIKIYPAEMNVQEVVRFENSSDPDDQAILYAISAPSKDIKGVYVDSYGFYHDELSKDLLAKLRECDLH